MKKLQSAIQYRDAQYKHEQKKKERELIKLKERIHFLISDKTEKRLGKQDNMLKHFCVCDLYFNNIFNLN